MLAQHFLQKRDFALLRGFKELLLDGRQRIHAVDFNCQRIFCTRPLIAAMASGQVAENNNV